MSMTPERKIEVLNGYHLLAEAAAKFVEAIENKIENAESDTVECRVDTLALIKMVLEVQSSELNKLVESTLETNDTLESIMTKHNIKMP